ncbi:MAG: glycosyltransferase family 2 protein [Bacteroidales bacterium]|nr:glycosyltransferase family 2 protein [Bacteroidales bacterium]
MESLISVIVPVYNVAEFVLPCLKSIAGQTYKNFECIVVDDGSTDNSGIVCEQFCQQDNRFHLIHQSNLGLGPARNTGVRLSRGEYILFVDSDDYLLPGTLSCAYQLIVSGSYDIAIFGFNKTDHAGVPFKTKTPSEKIWTLTGEEALCTLFFGPTYERYLMCLAWNKLYKRGIIQGIEMAAIAPGQDYHYNCQVYQRNPVIVCTEQPYYRWRQRNDSITHQEKSYSYKSFIVLASLNKDVFNSHSRFRHYYLRKLYRSMITSRYALLGSGYYHELMDTCHALFKETGKEYLSSRTISLKEKSLFFCLWPFPHFGRIVFKLMGN